MTRRAEDLIPVFYIKPNSTAKSQAPTISRNDKVCSVTITICQIDRWFLGIVSFDC